MGFTIIDGSPYPTILEEHSKRAHVAIIERKLGRKLIHREQIHHIDGDKKNFKIENLMLLDVVEHRRIHGRGTTGEELACVVCGKPKYFPKSYFNKGRFSSGSYFTIEDARRKYMCQKHYYESKRWLKGGVK